MWRKSSLPFLLSVWNIANYSAVGGVSGGSLTQQHQERRSLADMMAPGPRVAGMDRRSAICTAGVNYDLSVPMEETVIEYFYAIESVDNITTSDIEGTMLVRSLEETLFHAINPAILWCYYDESRVGKRYLKGTDNTRRRMTMEEARRLSIVTFSTTPEDEETTIECNFPTSSEYCVVMKGMMTIIHHVTSDISLATASIYDAIQLAMNNSDPTLLDGNSDYANITNIEWLGETEEDAINGGPNGVIPGGGGSSSRRVPVAYAVAVPLLILMALALFVARNKTRRQVLTPAQARALDNGGDVLVGTGDPPRSFHEGMYHYTRHGARYLSTNCPDCIETKRNGFFTEDDLETIHEGKHESFEDISLVATSASGSEHDPSGHRKRNLVEASNTALGVKHSSIDVHQCTSATCPICIYKPADVSFVSNAASPSSAMSGSTFGPV